MTARATTVTYGHEDLGRLAVAISPQGPGPMLAGTVTIMDLSAVLCTIRLSSGTASCTLSAKQLAVDLRKSPFGRRHARAAPASRANYDRR
jgi:hypothetical protein